MVIIWSARARRNFAALLAYTSRHSRSGAARVGRRIEETAASLEMLPWQGSLLPRGLRRVNVVRTPYMLITRVIESEVQIVAILHHAQNRRS